MNRHERDIDRVPKGLLPQRPGRCYTAAVPALRVFPAGLLLCAWVGCHRSPPPPPRPSGTDSAVAAPAADRLIVLTRKCMGTLCEFKAWHRDEALVQHAFEAAMAEMDRIEALTTSWRDTSDVSRINQAAGAHPVTVAPDTLAVIKKAQWVSELTQGAFDITVGVFKGLWKFDEDNDGSLPSPAEVKRRHRLVDYHDVIIDEAAGTLMLRRTGQRMNLEGLAKGYGVAAAVKAARAVGLQNFIMHAGGDMFAAGRHGDRDWRVGIQDPRGPHGRIIFELPLSDEAFNTSGDYERFVIRKGIRYHHILDARTGFPARGMRSVTLLAKDAFLADTLDTAIFAIGPRLGKKIIEDLPDLEGVIVDADNHVWISSGLRDKILKREDPTPGP